MSEGIAQEEPWVCQIDGCKNKYHGRGYCLKHYRLFVNKDGKSPPAEIPAKKTFPLTSLAPRYEASLSSLPNGDYSLLPERFHLQQGLCLVDWCNSPKRSRGYCYKHYRQITRIGRVLAPEEDTGPGKRHGSKRCGHQPLTKREEQEIIRLLSTTTMPQYEIARQVGLHSNTVGRVKKRFSVERPPSDYVPLRYCHWCDKPYRPPGISRTRPGHYKYCSKHCYTQWQKSPENQGPNNPGWVAGGNHEPELNALRKRDEWKVWRKAVYIRDDYTCQLCGIKGGRLHPHHIIKKSIDPGSVFDIDNGITLCKDCHMNGGVHIPGGEKEKLFTYMISNSREATIAHLPAR